MKNKKEETTEEKANVEEGKKRIRRSMLWIEKNVPENLTYRWIMVSGGVCWLKVVKGGQVTHKAVNMNDDPALQREVVEYLGKVTEYQRLEAEIDGKCNQRVMAKLIPESARAEFGLGEYVRSGDE